MIPYDLIRRPLITEKTNIQKESYNQITFEVDRNANRVEIKKAIQDNPIRSNDSFNQMVFGTPSAKFKHSRYPNRNREKKDSLNEKQFDSLSKFLKDSSVLNWEFLFFYRKTKNIMIRENNKLLVVNIDNYKTPRFVK